MRTLYQLGIVLAIEAEDAEQELQKTLQRIKDAIYADDKCKAFVSDRAEHKLVEWNGNP